MLDGKRVICWLITIMVEIDATAWSLEFSPEDKDNIGKKKLTISFAC